MHFHCPVRVLELEMHVLWGVSGYSWVHSCPDSWASQRAQWGWLGKRSRCAGRRNLILELRGVWPVDMQMASGLALAPPPSEVSLRVSAVPPRWLWSPHNLFFKATTDQVGTWSYDRLASLILRGPNRAISHICRMFSVLFILIYRDTIDRLWYFRTYHFTVWSDDDDKSEWLACVLALSLTPLRCQIICRWLNK